MIIALALNPRPCGPVRQVMVSAHAHATTRWVLLTQNPEPQTPNPHS